MNDLKHPPMKILGISDQKSVMRKKKFPRKKKETSYERKRAPREHESQRWEESVRELGEAEAGVRDVHVADRKADIYEYLFACQEQEHGYIVRAAQNRALHNSQTGRRKGRLFEKARAAQEFGSFKLKLRSRKSVTGRRAELKVSSVRVLLSPPKSNKFPRSKLTGY